MARNLFIGKTTPAASVTVYWDGTTTKPTIYDAEAGSAKANPITAAVDGSYAFWVDDGHYKIVNGSVGGDLTNLRLLTTPLISPSARDITTIPFMGNTATNLETFLEGLASGTTVLNTSIIKPSVDSTTAIKVTKADCTTAVMTFDTTNSIVTIPAASVLLVPTIGGCGAIYNGTNAGILINNNGFSQGGVRVLDLCSGSFGGTIGGYNIVNVIPTITNTGAVTNATLSIQPTYNQTSGTAANTDLLINRTETAVGSGAQLLIDAQVGSVSKFKVDNTGIVTQTTANGGEWVSGSSTELMTLSTSSVNTDSTANLLPANSLLKGVVARVITEITGGTNAQGTITMTGVATATETFVVDTQTFTWVVTRAVAGEVTIGASAAAAVTNIVAAITADLATVTAVDGAGDTVVVTAATGGAAGNSIVFTEASTNMAVDGAGTLGTTTAGADVTSWTLADTATAARFASANSTLTVGATSVGLNHLKGGVASDAAGPTQTSAAKLRITTIAPADAGAVRVTLFYETFVAPTS